MVWCTSCGENLEEQAMFCWRCGTRACKGPGQLTKPQPSKPAPSTATSTVPVAEEHDEGRASKSTATLPAVPSNVLGLSESALESLKLLRESMPGRKKPGPTKIGGTVTVGVQILDQKLKTIRKLIPKGENKVGIVDFQFGNSSDEEDWLQKIGKVFPGLTFKTAVKTGATFSLSSKKLTMYDLKRDRRERRTNSLRLYIVLADKGKDRKELLRSYKKGQCPVKEEDDLPEVEWLNQRRRTEVMVIPDEDGEDQSDCEFGQDEKRQKFAEKDEVLKEKKNESTMEEMVKEAIEKVMNQNNPVEMEPEVVEKEPLVEEELLVENEKGAEEEGEEIDQNESPFDYDSDLELKNFMVLQQKLDERKQVASVRISKLRQVGMKSFNIVYEALGYKSIVFNAPVDEGVRVLYDFVCSCMPACAARFFLQDDKKTKYCLDFKGKLGEVPSLLFLKEEEYNNDERITNYEEATGL